MSLETGMQINGRVVATLPITNKVIERVKAFGIDQQQPFRVSKMLQYEWRPGTVLEGDTAEEMIPAQIAQEIGPAGPNPMEI